MRLRGVAPRVPGRNEWSAGRQNTDKRAQGQLGAQRTPGNQIGYGRIRAGSSPSTGKSLVGQNQAETWEKGSSPTVCASIVHVAMWNSKSV